jgi:hypothetical protein
MTPPRLILLLLVMLAACKNTEEYLADLAGSLNKDGQLNPAVYDAGPLVHEAFSGLLEQDVLTLAQLGRAVHSAGLTLHATSGPATGPALLRADALSVLAHLALRYPLPPLSEAFSALEVEKVAVESINSLHDALEILEAEDRIATLANPDQVLASENHVRLKELTGQDFPQDIAPWEAWWEANRARILQEAQDAARQPIVDLTYLRYASLASSRAVLGYIATRVALHDLPALRPELTTCITRLSRQVVVYGIQRGLEDPDPLVRTGAARAAAEVLDPSFGPFLETAFGRETDTNARVRILKSLSFYPSRVAIFQLVASISDQARSVATTAREVLAVYVGEDFGEAPAPWRLWWEREGRTRWPGS